jgi:hypothetical protein
MQETMMDALIVENKNIGTVGRRRDFWFPCNFTSMHELNNTS